MRPSSTRRATPRVALAVRRATSSSWRSSATLPAHLGPWKALDVALELVDLLVEGVEQLEEGVRDIVDDGVHESCPGDASESMRAATPSTGARSPRGPDLRIVTSVLGGRQHVDLEVLDAVAERRPRGRESTAST